MSFVSSVSVFVKAQILLEFFVNPSQTKEHCENSALSLSNDLTAVTRVSSSPRRWSEARCDTLESRSSILIASKKRDGREEGKDT